MNGRVCYIPGETSRDVTWDVDRPLGGRFVPAAARSDVAVVRAWKLNAKARGEVAADHHEVAVVTLEVPSVRVCVEPKHIILSEAT